MPGFDDLDFGDDDDENEKSQGLDSLDFETPPQTAQPEPERGLTDDILDTLVSFGDGLGFSSMGELAGGGMNLAAKAGLIPEVEGGYVPSAMAQVDQSRARAPYANMAGKVAQGAAIGAATAGAGLPAVMAAEGMGGFVSGMGETGDPLDSLLQGGTAAAGAGLAGKLVPGSVRGQTPALERMLTRGDDGGRIAIDEIAGGSATRGTQGQGLERVMDRARQLNGGGPIDAKRLPAQATAELAARQGDPRVQAIQQSRLDPYINAVARDPKGAAWESSGVMSPHARARAKYLGQNPGDEQLLNDLAADAVIARAPVPGSNRGPTSLAEAAMGRGGMVKGAARWALGQHDAMTLNPAAQARGRIAAGTAGAVAGQELPDLFTSTAQAQPYLNMESRSADQAPEKDPDLRADSASLGWSLQSVLSSGKTGLPKEDEARLTKAVIDGDDDQIAAMNYQFQLKYPGYQRAVESRLRGLNGEQ